MGKGNASFQDEISSLKTKSSELKNFSNEFLSLKTDCDKNSKDLKSFSSKMDEIKKDFIDLKSENISSRGKIDKLLLFGKDIEQLKKEKSEDKLTAFEKEMSSLRSDYDKLNKDIKSVSTEVKYVDSTMKKDTQSTKAEMTTFSKNIKGLEKDLNTMHNMIDVLNGEKASSVNVDEITSLQNTISKSSKEQLEKIKFVEDTLTKKINGDIKDTESKIQKIKDELQTKLSNAEKK